MTVGRFASMPNKALSSPNVFAASTPLIEPTQSHPVGHPSSTSEPLHRQRSLVNVNDSTPSPSARYQRLHTVDDPAQRQRSCNVNTAQRDCSSSPGQPPFIKRQSLHTSNDRSSTSTIPHRRRPSSNVRLSVPSRTLYVDDHSSRQANPTPQPIALQRQRLHTILINVIISTSSTIALNASVSTTSNHQPTSPPTSASLLHRRPLSTSTSLLTSYLHQEMSSNDSSQIRRQIGFFKKQLQRHGLSVTTTLKEYHIKTEQLDFRHLENDELESLRAEIVPLRRNLLKSYQKITKLNDEWTTLQDSNTGEQEIFNEYISKYGDYRESISTSVLQLEGLDILLNAIDQEYIKRNIHVPSDLSDATSLEDYGNELTSAKRATIHHEHRSPLLHQATATHLSPDSPLLNFVDASILTKMELPTFDGNLLEYPEFSARFATLVGNKPQLDNTTKFCLLKSCLRGRALQSIQGLSMTAENYNIAMDILRTHFDDKVTMRHILYTKLSQLPPCDPEGHHLPVLYNRMFSLVRQFCNGEDDSKETALGALLLNKLPLRVRSQIYDKTGNSHNVTPSELLHLLTDIVRKDSTLFEIEYHSKQSPQLSNLHQSFVAKEGHQSNNSRPLPRPSTTKGKIKRCQFCNSTFHASTDCNIFPTPKQRSEQAKIRQLCYNCLSNRHSTKECTSRFLCTFCSKKHHSSLCFQMTSKKLRGTPPKAKQKTPLSGTRRTPRLQSHTVRMTVPLLDVPAVSENKSQIPCRPDNNPSSTDPSDHPLSSSEHHSSQLHTVSTHHSTQHSLQATLMCATVRPFNPSDPSREVTATAFLDSGSSKSYITAELATLLELPTLTTEKITISTFGSTTSLELPSKDHNIGVYTEEGAKYLDVKSVPTLTGSIQHIYMSSDPDRRFTHTSCTPSLLIGNDYFWDIVLSDNFFCQKMPSGYRLLHTTIGDIIINKQIDIKKSENISLFASEKGLSNPSNHDELSELVSNFWKFETIGILDDPMQRMNLRAYVSNSAELNKFFEEKEQTASLEHQKLLGLQWDTSNDTITIQLPEEPPPHVVWTKRKVLKHIASIYDPLGLISPITLRGKLFLQSLWRIELSWDDPLPEEQNDQWCRLLSSWTISSFTLPRLLTDVNDNSDSLYDLHVFTDASSTAYCATAYVVHRRKNAPPTALFLMSKSRLAPLNKAITIPRLELAALMIGAKLTTYLAEQLDITITRKFLWTDSDVTLRWIKGNKELPIFVRNRVKIIQDNTSDVIVRHIPGHLNPADIGTRGATTQELLDSSRRWSGPEFLEQKEDLWPSDNLKTSKTPSTTSYEEKESHSGEAGTTSSALVTSATQSTTDFRDMPASFPLDVERFSSWMRLVNTIFYILRFFVIKSKRASHHFGSNKVALLWKAETILFRVAQSQHPPSNEHKRSLNLFMCDTSLLWKCRGRIDYSELPQETITPIFLPQKSRITALFVLSVHQRNNHCGINHTLTLTRQSVWIPKGRATIKRILHEYCFHCKRYSAKPYSLPPFPAHPQRRVKPPTYPFENTGMDFFGPLQYRNADNVADKFWMILLTCLNCRAIYVDVVTDMSALTGGIYEKMIDIFKKSFKHAIGNRLMNIDDVKTIAKETEAIVNTRPLTYYTDDINYYPLRPIDFLRPHARLSGPQPLERTDEWSPVLTTRDTLLADWKRTAELVTSFWKRWLQEYVTALREQYRTEHTTPRSHEKEPPRQGDFVLVHDPLLQRGQWRMGKVVGSQDNFRRSVEIKLPNRRIITRPHNLVFKLEVPPASPSPNPPPATSSGNTLHPMITRSKARLLNNAVLLCNNMVLLCLMILTIQGTSSAHTRCPEEININKTILFATECTPKGIAIARYEHDNKNVFCWFPIICPFGEIRFDASKPTVSPICGKKCKCPDWTDSCSFSSSSRTTTSQIDLMPTSIKNYKPAYVCSFNFNSSCDPGKRMGVFNQIQLFDDNVLLVEKLTITIKDYIDKNDYVCIDWKGWKRRIARRSTGTSRFCQNHDCRDNAQVFCTYDNPLALLVIDDTSSIHEGAIPIKAWGSITKAYYEFRKDERIESSLNAVKRSIVTPAFGLTTPLISVQCIKGGVSIDNLFHNDITEICVSQYCVFARSISSKDTLFPNSLIMYDYSVSIKTWNNGTITDESTVSCKAHPICETLRCTFCWEHIYNVQCWTNTQMIIIALSFLIIFLILPGIRFIGKIVLVLIAPLLSILAMLNPSKIFHEGSRPHRTQLRTYTNRRRRIHNRRFLTCVISIIIHLHYSEGCSQVSSLTGNEAKCVTTGNAETCTFNEATLLTLQPLQQATCLTLRDKRDNAVGVISIKIKGINFRCHKNVEFFTRDHKIVSESVHRCYNAGSCVKDACDNTSPTDKIKEFSSTANSSPGYTFCTISCGCIFCEGCFFCQPSCLFYRLYAIPTSSTIYTVFSCPSWETIINIEVEILQEELKIANTLQLLPGQTTSWNNLRFTLIGNIIPQLPILSSTFMETRRNRDRETSS
ncbi:zinc knuckle [Ostertagia ostertagi]